MSLATSVLSGERFALARLLSQIENDQPSGHEALGELAKDEVLKEALGSHIFENFIAAKTDVWREYSAQVSQWELDRYLGGY